MFSLAQQKAGSKNMHSGGRHLGKMCFPARRESPDGQSFRSLGDEAPADFRRNQDRDKHTEGDDYDDDYENVREIEVMCQLH